MFFSVAFNASQCARDFRLGARLLSSSSYVQVEGSVYGQTVQLDIDFMYCGLQFRWAFDELTKEEIEDLQKQHTDQMVAQLRNTVLKTMREAEKKYNISAPDNRPNK